MNSTQKLSALLKAHGNESDRRVEAMRESMANLKAYKNKDVFEQLLDATAISTVVNITGLVYTHYLPNGYKQSMVTCCDGVKRRVTYKGNISDAFPESTLTVTDINAEMTA